MSMEEALSKVEEIQELEGYDGTIIDAELKTSAREKGKIIDIALRRVNLLCLAQTIAS